MKERTKGSAQKAIIGRSVEGESVNVERRYLIAIHCASYDALGDPSRRLCYVLDLPVYHADQSWIQVPSTLTPRHEESVRRHC